MSMGVPYDSDQGRDMADAVHRRDVRPGVFDQRAHRPRTTGPFPGYAENEQPFLQK